MARRNQSCISHRKTGVVGIPRDVIKSAAYKSLSGTAAKLIPILQEIWAPDRTTFHFSVERAEKALGVSHPTACNAFLELQKKGFIELVHPHEWSNGKAREWRLTWIEPKGRIPTDEWASWKPTKENNSGKNL